jgi:hypothetical protein
LPANTSGTADRPLAPQLAQDPEDPDLARLVAAWPSLPEHIRAAVVALVAAAR